MIRMASAILVRDVGVRTPREGVDAMGEPVEIFYSYSHKDEELRDELETHLSIMKRQGLISPWHDRCITAGTEWAGKIDAHLDSAKIILLLVSNYFMASDYCWDVELKRAMERHATGSARVIPIILRPVDMKDAPFAKLQALPKDAKPVTRWGDRDEAFVDIARGIRRVVETIQNEGAKTVTPKPPAVGTPKPPPVSGVNSGAGTAPQATAPNSGSAAASEGPHPALEIWKKKLVSLQVQEATAVDPAIKFAIEQEIEKARAKIREYGG